MDEKVLTSQQVIENGIRAARSNPIKGLWPIKNGTTRRHSIKIDICPECGGELDTGYECNACGFDGQPELRMEPTDDR